VAVVASVRKSADETSAVDERRESLGDHVVGGSVVGRSRNVLVKLMISQKRVAMQQSAKGDRTAQLILR